MGESGYENNGIDLRQLTQYVDTVRRDADMARIRFRATSSWQGGCRSAVRIAGFDAGGQEAAPAERAFELNVDEPAVLGGSDAAPNPVEHLAAGLCGCLTAGIATNAALFETPLERIEVDVAADFDILGLLGLAREVPTGAQHLHYTVRLKGPGAPEALEKAKQTIDGKSPIVNTLKGAVRVTSELIVEH